MSNLDTLIAAIAAVQTDLSVVGIQKDRKNQQQGYKFRGIDDVYNTISPMLAKHGLVIVPSFSNHRIEERESRKGDRLNYAFVTGTFHLFAKGCSESISAVTIGEAMDSADKATNKAMSAAYKYALMQLFAIPTDADNDADLHTPEVAPARRPAAHDTFEPATQPVGEDLEKESQAALLAMAGMVGHGMGAIQKHMDTLPAYLQSYLRAKHRDALKSLKTAVDKANASEMPE